MWLQKWNFSSEGLKYKSEEFFQKVEQKDKKMENKERIKKLKAAFWRLNIWLIWVLEIENKGKRKEEVIKENFPEQEDMSKGKIPEASKGKLDHRQRI